MNHRLVVFVKDYWFLWNAQFLEKVDGVQGVRAGVISGVEFGFGGRAADDFDCAGLAMEGITLGAEA